jgi:Cu2+-exporting ATPase
MSRIENALGAMPGVLRGRVNLTTRRVGVDWESGRADADAVVETLTALGYQARPFNAEAFAAVEKDEYGRGLLRALAVAGFAAGNVMLLSVSVWSGASDTTRDLFHWISAMIALPAIAYAGRPFYRSAWRALVSRRLNMDVPISLAVLLAAGMSLAETWAGGSEAYFDAAVMLLFFLLIGRYLDHRMRAKARQAASGLLSLRAEAATVLEEGGKRRLCPLEDLRPGMMVAVAPGERLPVDGVVRKGHGLIDRALITGESLPESLAPGGDVFAGTLNLDAALEVEVTAAGEDTLLAEIVRLMEAAEQGKARYRRLADRAAAIYAPAVHILAALTCLGWLVASGGDWRLSLYNAIAVLIITCPCALGLAVPVVQVVASGALFRRGILVKDGSALERLAEIDHIVFDKTGTLTLGQAQLVSTSLLDEQQEETLDVLAALARASKHPLARALAEALKDRNPAPAAGLEGLREIAGCGLEARLGEETLRLGRPDWVLGADIAAARGREDGEETMQSQLAFRQGNGSPLLFAFADRIRPDARAILDRLRDEGLGITLLSGDREGAVAGVAGKLAIRDWHAGFQPQDKLGHLAALKDAGRRCLMAGDGLNDAPALAAAHVSISPVEAADVSQVAADFLFQGENLQPVEIVWRLAVKARRLILQNFALALCYNVIAVPLAVAGLASPLIAALAMSASSLAVTANALRLDWRGSSAKGVQSGRPAAAQASSSSGVARQEDLAA